MRVALKTVVVLALGLFAALPVAALPADEAASTCLSAPLSTAADTIDLAVLLGVPASDADAPAPSRCAQCASGAPCCWENTRCDTWCQGLGLDGGVCLRRCCICLVIE